MNQTKQCPVCSIPTDEGGHLNCMIEIANRNPLGVGFDVSKSNTVRNVRVVHQNTSHYRPELNRKPTK